MSDMNPFLADLYNTAENVGADDMGSDLEKMAQAEVVDQILASEGLTVDDVDAYTILKVAEDLFGPYNELAKLAQEAEEEEEEEEGNGKKNGNGNGKKNGNGNGNGNGEEEEESAEEKMAQADFLGRQMAHAYYDEMRKLGADVSRYGSRYEEFAGAPKRTREGIEAMGRFGKRLGKETKGGSKLTPAMEEAAKKLSKNPTLKAGLVERLGKWTAKHPKASGVGAALGIAGLTAGTGYGAYRGAKALFGKEKKSSALDILAEERAIEMLKEAGFPIEELFVDDEQEKLAAAVDYRALQMLAEAGFPVE